MAKGYDKHQERLQAINALGRALARRARSTCELCETSGVPLAVHEVPPLPEEPEEERAVMVCQRCGDLVDGGKIGRPDELRFLEGVVWSEVAAIQVAAVRLLRRLSGQGADWAADVIEGLYLDPDVAEWADAE